MEKTQSAAEEKRITAPEEPPAEEKTELAIEPATERVAAEEPDAEEIAAETTAAEEIAAAAAEQIAEDAPSVGLEESAQEQPAEEFKPKSGFRYGCYLFVKRSFDIFASFLAIVLLSWLILICILVKWLEDFHNPIYVSKRVGKNGKVGS